MDRYVPTVRSYKENTVSRCLLKSRCQFFFFFSVQRSVLLLLHLRGNLPTHREKLSLAKRQRRMVKKCRGWTTLHCMLCLRQTVQTLLLLYSECDISPEAECVIQTLARQWLTRVLQWPKKKKKTCEFQILLPVYVIIKSPFFVGQRQKPNELCSPKRSVIGYKTNKHWIPSSTSSLTQIAVVCVSGGLFFPLFLCCINQLLWGNQGVDHTAKEDKKKGRRVWVSEWSKGNRIQFWNI